MKTFKTSFCDCAHDLDDGAPIGHVCYALSPDLLQREAAGDFEGLVPGGQMAGMLQKPAKLHPGKPATSESQGAALAAAQRDLETIRLACVVFLGEAPSALAGVMALLDLLTQDAAPSKGRSCVKLSPAYLRTASERQSRRQTAALVGTVVGVSR